MTSTGFTVGDDVEYIGPNLSKGIKGIITETILYQPSKYGNYLGPWHRVKFEGRNNNGILCIPKNLKLIKPKMMIYRKEGVE